MLVHVALVFGRIAIACDLPVNLTSCLTDRRHICLAQTRRRLDQRIEHCLQIEGRAADDLEHVGGGGLLLQRFAQLVEQPRVLDGDDGLGGEVRKQSDLLLGEGAHFLPVDGERADQLIILEHRHVDRRPRAAERDRRGCDTVGGIVGSVAHLLCPHDVIEVTARRRSNRSALHEFDKCRRRTEVRSAAKRLAIKAHQHPEFGLANSCGILQQGLENRLHVAARAGDDPQHLRCGLLSLQRLVALTGELSNVRLVFVVGNR